MLVPLLLTLHVWQPPPLRPPRLEAPALAAVLPEPALLDAVLAEGPPKLVDPFAGGLSGVEVAAGVGGSLVGAAGAVALGFVSSLVACAANLVDNSGDVPACLGVGVVLWGLGQLGLPPLLAAGAANAVSDPPLAGSFALGVARAYEVQGLGLVASVLVGLVAAAAAGGNAGGTAFLVSFALVELVGLPIAASWGLHDGPAEVAQPAAPNVAPPVPPQLQPPPSYTPEAPPPPVQLAPPPATVGFAVPF